MRLEQRETELAAIGASLGANCRPCIEHHLPAGREAGHIGTALEAGLSSTEVEAARKMAEYVQQRAAEMTAEKATHVLEEWSAASVQAAQGISGGAPFLSQRRCE